MQNILLVVVLALGVTATVDAQIWMDVVPGKSTRIDVEQKLGSGSRIGPEITQYKLKGEFFFVRYYTGGCDRDQEKLLGLTHDSVLELKNVRPQKKSSPIAVSYHPQYTIVGLSGGRKAYVDRPNGFIAISEPVGRGIDLATRMYYLPRNLSLSNECLVDLFDMEVRQILRSLKALPENEKGTYLSQMIFPSSRELTKEQTQELEEFIGTFNRSKESNAYVIVYIRRGTPADERTYWREYLRQKLSSLPHPDGSQAIFIDGGEDKESSFHFLVLPEAVGPPIPRRAIQ